jgi:hypothetical protein
LLVDRGVERRGYLACEEVIGGAPFQPDQAQYIVGTYSPRCLLRVPTCLSIRLREEHVGWLAHAQVVADPNTIFVLIYCRLKDIEKGSPAVNTALPQLDIPSMRTCPNRLRGAYWVRQHTITHTIHNCSHNMQINSLEDSCK